MPAPRGTHTESASPRESYPVDARASREVLDRRENSSPPHTIDYTARAGRSPISLRLEGVVGHDAGHAAQQTDASPFHAPLARMEFEDAPLVEREQEQRETGAHPTG